MNRFLFLGNLIQVAWLVIDQRAQLHRRDLEALQAAFDWGQLCREVLLSRIDRTQALWEQRIMSMIRDAEAKVPVLIMPAGVAIPEMPQEGVNGRH